MQPEVDLVCVVDLRVGLVCVTVTYLRGRRTWILRCLEPAWKSRKASFGPLFGTSD